MTITELNRQIQCYLGLISNKAEQEKVITNWQEIQNKSNRTKPNLPEGYKSLDEELADTKAEYKKQLDEYDIHNRKEKDERFGIILCCGIILVIIFNLYCYFWCPYTLTTKFKVICTIISVIACIIAGYLAFVALTYKRENIVTYYDGVIKQITEQHNSNLVYKAYENALSMYESVSNISEAFQECIDYLKEINESTISHINSAKYILDISIDSKYLNETDLVNIYNLIQSNKLTNLNTINTDYANLKVSISNYTNTISNIPLNILHKAELEKSSSYNLLEDYEDKLKLMYIV